MLPDPGLSLSDRPIAPWNTPAYESTYDDLFRACRLYSVRTDVPVERLSAHEREVLFRGRGDFYGVDGFFEWLETKRYKIHVRVLLARYRAYTLCPDCQGARIGPAARSVRFRGLAISDLAEMPLSDLARWFDALEVTADEEARLGSVLSELRSRIRYMPSIEIVPALGLRKPSRHESRVVFPAPFGPIRPSVSPRATSRLTSWSAGWERP